MTNVIKYVKGNTFNAINKSVGIVPEEGYCL